MAEHKMDRSSLELGELPSNSLKSRQAAEKGGERPKVEPVASAKKVKKPAGRRFLDSIGVEDGRTVWDYILWDVMLPSFKEMLSSVVKNGIDVFLYGQVKAKNVERRGRTSRVSYARYYEEDQPRRYTYQPRAAMDFSDIVFEDRASAETVLSKMVDIIDDYSFVKVSDFLMLSGVDDMDISHTDHDMGWYRLSAAGVDRVRNGYILHLPKPVPFD